MVDSPERDQDPRKSIRMEDSTGMTIEFLRARLLSERSVSRTARQRADELANRVAELEEQLSIVNLQRRKAEKATADVLAILRSHGIGDISETFDSGSDQEESVCESKIGTSSMELEDSADAKLRRKDMEVSSGSELESPSITGRSLSWKSGKNSSYSLEKKKYTDSSRRRRTSFTSAGSSSTRSFGKSCRQIKHREPSSTADFSNEASVCSFRGVGEAECLEAFPDCSNNGTESLREDSENFGGKETTESIVSVALETQRVDGIPYFDGCGGDKDMERALERQAQLIGKYEAEENAQREWEERFRVHNDCLPDSCEPGNRSDVSEERDEMKASTPIITSQSQPIMSQDGNCASDDSETPNVYPSPVEVNPDCISDEKFSTTYSHESGTPQIAAAIANEQLNYRYSKNHPDLPWQSQLSDYDAHSQCAQGNDFTGNLSSYGGGSLNEAAVSGNEKALALIPHESSDKLGSVLVALHQAKLSLKEKLSQLPPERETGNALKILPVARTTDMLDIPIGCPGLFRLPTDFQPEATTRSDSLGSLSSDASLANHSAGVDGADRKFSRPSMEFIRSRTSTEDRFLTTPSITPYTDINPGVSNRGPVLDPNMAAGFPYSIGYSTSNSQLGTLPFTSNSPYSTYPIYKDQAAQMQMNRNDGLSRSLQHRGFEFSYEDRIRPDIYR